MRVLHLCYYYGNNTSGAPVAALRLHEALQEAGVESHFVCVEQRQAGVNVHVLPKSRLMNRLFYLVVRACWVVSGIVTGKMKMPNVLPLLGLEKTVREIAPDVIHVQYIGQDMLSFAQLARLPQPKIFTLHDLTIANAVEAHPGGDARFFEGFGRGNSSWYERWMFNRKRKLIAAAALTFTGPSDWVCGMFSRSALAQGRSARMIANIIDPAYRFDPDLRRPHAKFTLLFGAYGGRSSPYKGWCDFLAALPFLPEELRRNLRVLVFGESAADETVHAVDLHFLGAIREPEKIRALHHDADALLLPSRLDNAPQVKFEALMDGLPVLAFERAGCAECLEHKKNGWRAKDGDVKGYADGIAFFYRLWKDGALEARHGQIAAGARRCFSRASLVARYVEVYRDALAGAAAGETLRGAPRRSEK